MASNKYLELQEFSVEELGDNLSSRQVEYRNLQLDNAVKGLDNPLVLRELRRDIARLKTEIRRRELNELTPEQKAGRSKIVARRRSKF